VKKERFFSLVQLIRVFKHSNWLNNFNKFLFKKQIVGDDIFKERLEVDTLENMKLINKKENFNQKYIKIKTRLL